MTKNQYLYKIDLDLTFLLNAGILTNSNTMCKVWWQMIKRKYWIQKIEEAWKKRSVIWLSGVRRAGKTCLCKSLDKALHFDCELPRVRRLLEDPEVFLQSHKGQRIILDEIHRLTNPSELLKIAADHFPDVKVIATGSSTLSASNKFRDSLTGRKVNIHLPPMLFHELHDFDGCDLPFRLLRGGLPPFFMEKTLPESEYQEWLVSYWAKDIQELFRLEKRHSFLKFTELVLAQSGSMFEASRFAAPCEVSRSTIANYLSVLETTYVASVIRPFSTYAATEIVSAPKVYGFDTGFVCHCRGWIHLRPDDYGHLWEHIVLNELVGRGENITINYWRDKQDHEIDFILSKRKADPIAVECKWSSGRFDPSNLKAFRRRYPDGKNYVVTTDIDKPFDRIYDGMKVVFTSLENLLSELD